MQEQITTQSQKIKKLESKVVGEDPLFEGKWIGLKYTHFTIGERIVNNYETVYRTTTKKSGRDIDGVEIIPIIKYADNTKPNQVVMIACFRPPISKFALEFPSGLLEDNDYEENGRREVLEETGYVIHHFVKLPCPPIYCDPWKSNQSAYFYLGIIDGDNPDSYKSQSLQSEENIFVHTLALNQKFMENVHFLAEKNEYAVESKLWSICIGLNLTRLLQ